MDNNVDEKRQYSVLMSVYKNDDPTFLKAAIESMLAQTATPEQFVIVVDGPIGIELDNVIQGYQKNEKLFSVLRLEENQGLGNALNRGMDICRNELIARMDSDDISMPSRCEKQLARFAQVPELAILGTQIDEFIGDEDNIISKRVVPCTYEEIRKFARRRSPFNHPTVMYKKSVIKRLGGYPTLNRKEDLGLFVLAVCSGVYSENLEESLLHYRTNIDNQKRRRTWVNCREYIQVMFLFYKRGFIGCLDMLYVIAGQVALFVLPVKATSFLSNKYLREKE